MYAEKMAELHQQLLALRIADWYDKVISWQWLLLVILLILPWYIWWKLVDRKLVAEIFAYGLIVAVISSLFNANFLNLGFFSYPYRLIPISGRAYAFSLSVIPVTYMFLYQYFPTWKSFIIANTTVAAIAAFIIQPLLAWADIYKLINWNYFCSFVVLLIIGLVGRFIIQVVLQKAKPGRSSTKISIN